MVPSISEDLPEEMEAPAGGRDAMEDWAAEMDQGSDAGVRTPVPERYAK